MVCSRQSLLLRKCRYRKMCMYLLRTQIRHCMLCMFLMMHRTSSIHLTVCLNAECFTTDRVGHYQ